MKNNLEAKEINRGPTLDDSGNSCGVVASGYGLVLYAGRFHTHPSGPSDRGGINSRYPGPSPRLTDSRAIH